MQERYSHQGIFGLIIALLLVLLLVVLFVIAIIFGIALFLIYFPWLFLAIIIFLLIWWVFRAAFGWSHRHYYYYYQYPYAPHAYGRTPEEVLDRRYAHGEITRDEYLRMREDMRMGR